MHKFAALVKKAVSYSSASITKGAPWPKRADTEKLRGTPPTKNPGARPAHSKIQASMAVVVVLPCVPATARTWRPQSTCSASHCGPLV
jgi:hypothetical protein